MFIINVAVVVVVNSGGWSGGQEKKIDIERWFLVLEGSFAGEVFSLWFV